MSTAGWAVYQDVRRRATDWRPTMPNPAGPRGVRGLHAGRRRPGLTHYFPHGADPVAVNDALRELSQTTTT